VEDRRKTEVLPGGDWRPGREDLQLPPNQERAHRTGPKSRASEQGQDEAEEVKKQPRPRGTGCVFEKPGSRYLWIKYSKNGRQFFESAKTDNRRKAERLLNLRTGEIVTGTFLGPQLERVKVAELAADLMSEYRANQRKSLGHTERRWRLHLEPVFGAARAVEVTTPALNRYIEDRQRQKAKNATINRELAVLKRAMNLGKRNQKVRVLPVFPMLEENNVRKGFMPEGADEKLVRACPELWFRAFLEIARNYGWRKSEPLSLKVRNVDLLARMYFLEDSKNGESREVKMTEAQYQLLRLCVAGKKPDDSVLTREDGRPVKDFRKTWQNSCCSTGLGHFRCTACGEQFTQAGKHCAKCKGRLKYHGMLVHDLRRTGRREMRRKGIPDDVAMYIGGWLTPSCAKRYNILDSADLEEAARKMDAAAKAQTSKNGDIMVTVAPEPGQNVPTVAKPEAVN